MNLATSVRVDNVDVEPGQVDRPCACHDRTVPCVENSVAAGATILMMNGLLLDLDDFDMSAIHQQIRQEVCYPNSGIVSP